MTHQWKPGDVALIEAGCHANRRVAIRTGTPSNMGWAYSDTFDGRSTQTWTADSHGTVSVVRQLVVIDPEDREQVEQLAHLLCAQPDDDWGCVRDALRDFIADPKPEEPKSAAALVEDRDGAIWIRQCSGTAQHDMSHPWLQAVNGRVPGLANRESRWSDVAAVKILSEGVTS